MISIGFGRDGKRLYEKGRCRISVTGTVHCNRRRQAGLVYGSGLEYKMKDPSYLIAQVDNSDFFDFTFVDDNRVED